MWLPITYTQTLQALGNTRLVWHADIVPKRCPPVSNSPYRPGYDWLFVYERKLAAVLEPWLGSHRHELIGPRGILCEALSNAFCHGNGRNSELPIAVSVVCGDRGLVVRIVDGGKGFDVDGILADFDRGKAYFHIAGNGIRQMAVSTTFGVFFGRGGAAFHLVYAFSGDPGSILSRVSPASADAPLPSPSDVGPVNWVPMPDAVTEIRWAVLVTADGRIVAGCGRRSRRVRTAAAHALGMAAAVRQTLTVLDVGDMVHVTVFDETEAIFMVRAVPDTDRLLIARLNRLPNIVLAGIYLDRLWDCLDAATGGMGFTNGCP